MLTASSRPPSLPGPRTLCGSLSRHPVSLGAAMHRAGYAALHLDYDYFPFAVNDLRGALIGMRALNIRGFGVSMPFKLEIMPWLDQVDPLAERIGAVNTVVNEDGQLRGYNTDAYGARRALEERLPNLADRRLVVIGAGGAARAVAFALKEAGAVLHLANRGPQRAQELADRLNQSSGPQVTASGLDGVRDLSDVAAVVNASSAGMAEYGAASPMPEAALHSDLVVMDIVYKPLDTELLGHARRAGARTIDGSRMLLFQACRQFELYTGHEAPVTAMNEALGHSVGVRPSL